MGKSKKKKKNADFQKVKLKVGKKLSKGDNITNLSFKTRQIQLTQSIRTGDTTLPVTKRNFSIQDLLRQCDHHSIGIRVNAISGIKELLLENFTNYLVPSNVYGYGTIIKKLSSMLLDNESDVRHTVINLLKLTFTKLKKHNLNKSMGNLISGNLFSHIHAFLCCAMNHIHEDVRLDALILFDALLEAFPQAMVQQTGDLLKNLIGMISSPISIGTKSNTVTQRLSMNPDSKLPVMKFRARVLLRIKLTLQIALLEVNNVESFKTEKSHGGSIWRAFSEEKVEGTKQTTLLVTQERLNKFGLIFKGAVCDSEDYIMKASSLEEFIRLSVPILLQAWKEAKASGQNDNATETVLSYDALEVMSLVVSVIELLFSLSGDSHGVGQSNDSRSEMIPVSNLTASYESSFTEDFMDQFPYSTLIDFVAPKKRKIKGKAFEDKAPTQSSMSSLNLCVCHIMSHFCRDCSDKKEKPWLDKLLKFVIRSFEGSPSPDHNRLLIKILTNILMNPILLDKNVPVFEAAYRYYSRCKVKHPQKKDLFNFLYTVYKRRDGNLEGPQSNNNVGTNYSEKMAKTVNHFLQGLPRLLLQIQRVNSSDLEWVKNVLSCISSSINSQFNNLKDELKGNLTSILDSDTGLICSDDEAVQQKLLFLLSLGSALDQHQLKQVLWSIRRPALKPVLPHRKSCSLACQAVTCISAGIQRNIPLASQIEFNKITQEQRDILSDYLKFMFSLLLGMSKDEMEDLGSTKENKKVTNWKAVDYSVERDQWNRHLDIASTVCSEIISLQIPASPEDGYKQSFTFVSNIEVLWKHTLASYKTVHIMSAYSLLKFIYLTSRKHFCEKPSPEMYALTSTIVAYVLASFYSSSIKSDNFTKEIVEQMKSEIISCLHFTKRLLSGVMNTLVKQKDSIEASKEEKLAAARAIEFVLADERLNKKLQKKGILGSLNLGEPMINS